MNINEAFPSKYLKAGDFPQPILLQMTLVAMEEMGSNPKENKPVLYFEKHPSLPMNQQGQQKGMVMNITRKDVITGRYGPQTEGWTGQSVWLLGGMTVAFGENTATIIVSVDQPQMMAPGPQADAYQEMAQQQPGPAPLNPEPAPLNNPPDATAVVQEMADPFNKPAQTYPDGRPYPDPGQS